MANPAMSGLQAVKSNIGLNTPNCAFRENILLIHFPIVRRRIACALPEYLAEILAVRIAYLQGNLILLHLGANQEFLGFIYPVVFQITGIGLPYLLVELHAEVLWRNV